MKQLIIALGFGISSCMSYAQDSAILQPQAQPAYTNLAQQVDSLSGSVDSLGTAVAQMQQRFQPADYVSQSVIDSVKQNSCVLFEEPKCSRWIYQVFGWILFAGILLGGIYLATSTSLCRDESFDEQGRLRPYNHRPYSYSRIQLFWWTMIILCCYVSFFAMYGQLIPLNMTTVLLLGLGSTVYAGGKILDERQKQSNPIGDRNQDQNAKDDSFFKDILSDDSGISIHRFQTVIFNVAFGIGFVSYFVVSLCGPCRYPFMDLNEWQFALLGISSATYLGLKAAENNPNSPPPAPNGQNDINPPAPLSPNTTTT